MKFATTFLAMVMLLIAPLATTAQDFCDNLQKIHKLIKFDNSFDGIIGKQISRKSVPYGDGQLVTTTYEATQELIMGQEAIIIHHDYPGMLDFWTYQLTTSIIYDKKSQEDYGKYWSNLVKECVKDEDGWTFSEKARDYDYEEKVYIWTASRPLDTHFGFKVKNITVYVFEEKENYKPTGRYGLRIEIG